MTEEQKLRRAENARANGRRSRGPVTPAGRYRSSLNAIATGAHLEIHQEELPAFCATLNTDDRKSYVRLFQRLLRQLKPQSEAEQELVRRMTAELFQYDRLVTAENYALQVEIDKLAIEFPMLGDLGLVCQGLQRCAAADKFLRLLDRRKRQHLAAYRFFERSLLTLRRDFPMHPPEPCDIAADDRVGHEPVPPPEVVREILALADRAKNEPAFLPPDYIFNLLENEELMAKVAPDYDPGDLLLRYGRRKPPVAA